MRRTLIIVASIGLGSAAHAQTTTNCTTFGSTVRCSTTPDAAAQTQQNMNNAFSNFGAAIAARRERKRQEREAAEAAAIESATAAEAAATQAATDAAIRAAGEADTATHLPPPTGEQPALLACTMGGSPVSLALYEKHNRVDDTAGGITETRPANFSTASATWVTPLIRFSLSRVD